MIRRVARRVGSYWRRSLLSASSYRPVSAALLTRRRASVDIPFVSVAEYESMERRHAVFCGSRRHELAGGFILNTLYFILCRHDLPGGPLAIQMG